ncbi:MAG: hydrogenase-4 component G [Helicobacter sp.]|nr:hydrogenase-4 component G [Helicobacter sp.]
MDANPLKKEDSTQADKESDIKKAASKVDARSLMMSYAVEFQMQVMLTSENNFKVQDGVAFFGESALSDSIRLNSLLGGIDLSSIGYVGKPLKDLSVDEAKALIAEDGFFGVAKTADRIADFVILGAKEDIEKLKAGREGVIKGYDQAKKSWGGKLPDISKETLEKALEKIDKRLAELGENVLDQNV